MEIYERKPDGSRGKKVTPPATETPKEEEQRLARDELAAAVRAEEDKLRAPKE